MARMNRLYNDLLEAVPDAMVVVNHAGEIIMLNLQAEKTFCYSRDELIGQKVTRIIPEGFAERLIADALRSTEDALAQQMGTGIELSGRRKCGSEFPIEIMLSPLENAEGILVTAAIRDISVRKVAEEHLAQMEGRRQLVEESLRESLRECEERYRMLLDGIQHYAVFAMDPHGQIVSWNAGAERIKGYKAEEIIGHNFSCFFPLEDIERGRPPEVLRLAAASGRYEEQGMRVRKDGSRFLASLTFTALRDSAGNLRGFSEFSHDLSESKESGAKYRGLLEAAPDSMVVVNQAGEIVLLNLQAEKQFGYYRDELLGQQVTNIIPEGFAERLIADGTRTAAEALAQHIGTGIELCGRRRDGTEFPIEIMLSPLDGQDGVLITAAIRDITQRKFAEAALLEAKLTLEHRVCERTEELAIARDRAESADRLKSAFLATMSHELRTPLNSIIGFTGVLMQRLAGPLNEEQARQLGMVQGSGRHLLALINDVLDISQIEADRVVIHTKVFDLQATLERVIETVKSLADAKGLVFQHSNLQRFDRMVSDQRRVEQMLLNLLSNAVKFTERGKVMLSVDTLPKFSFPTGPPSACVRFRVTDTGIGIRSEDLPRLFLPFGQLDTNLKMQQKGTGLGLAICRRLSQLLGGETYVESELGVGSVFTIMLPLLRNV
jgi:PAS domain S-box-containing protein